MTKHTLTSVLVATTLAAAGCATTTTGHATKPKPAGKDARKPPTPKLLKVGTAASPPAWLQAPCPGKRCKHMDPTSGTLVAAGGKVSVIRTYRTKMLYGFHADRGVVGPLAWPGGKMQWMVVAAGGRLVATDDAGHLWTAVSVDAAQKAEGWTKVTAVPATAKRAAAGEWLVYGEESHVFVARWPAGAAAPGRFKKSRPEKGGQVLYVAVRPDGVVAAYTRKTAGGGKKGVTHTVWHRAAGKKRWAKSAYRPRRLASDGHWIWNGEGACVEALAADGTTWLAPRKNRWEYSSPFNGNRRAMRNQARAVLETRSYLSTRPAGLRFDAPAPLANRYSGYVATGRSTCRSNSALLGMLGGRGGGCKGARCLAGTRGEAPKATPQFVALYGDGVCDAPKCVSKTPMSRPPTVALGDRNTGVLRQAKLPKGCHPERLDTAGGLAVLVCRAKKGQPASIYAMGSDNPGKWHFEGRLNGPPKPDQTLGADGTLVMHQFCPRDGGLFGSFGGGVSLGGSLKIKGGAPRPMPKPKKPSCSVWVRKPVAAGTPDAWREVSTPAAVAYRAGLGGHVLAIKVDKKAPQLVELVLVPPEGSSRTLSFASGPKVDSLDVLSDGTVRFTDYADAKKTGKKNQRRRYIYDDAELR